MGESEFQAFVKAFSIGLGAVAMCRDFGKEYKLKVLTDSTTSQGISARRGVGKIRHLHVPLLWVQSKVQSGEIEVGRIPGKQNCSDMGTKHIPAAEIIQWLHECGFVFLEGRSKLALKAQLR